MPARSAAWVLVAAVSAACGALAWNLGVTLEDRSIVEPDFLWRPNETLVEQRFLVMAVACAVIAVACFVFPRLRRVGALPEPEVAVPVLLIGVVIGGSYSVVTAPTIGANIGGGIVLMFGPFVLLGLVFVAVRAARAARGPHSSTT